MQFVYLSQAGVYGADQHSERLSSAAPHGAEHFAQKRDEAQPALHIGLLQLLTPREVPLQTHTENMLQNASYFKRKCDALETDSIFGISTSKLVQNTY